MAISKPRQGSADWSIQLTRRLTLKSGDTLQTLSDARRVVLPHLTSEVKDFALTEAMRLLLTAAETGTFADRNAATVQVATVLRWRGVY
jgi:hypothetical protein